MKIWKLLTLSVLMSSNTWAINQNEFEETLYYQYQNLILSNNKSLGHAALNSFEQKLFVDALWDLAEDSEPRALDALEDIRVVNYDLSEKLRIALLQLQVKIKTSFTEELVDELSNHLLLPAPDLKIIYLIASYKELLINAELENLVGLASQFPEFSNVNHEVIRNQVESSNVAFDLFYNSPKVEEYRDGRYEGGVKLFMFCRTNRNYPCMFALRDANDEIVRNTNGSIWTQRSLAQSARKLPYNIRNGATPAGVWTIDSVMPHADQRISFGRYRRMIMNFIPKTKDENRLKSLIPASSHNSNWWKQSIVARDLDRNLFRIHGTGKQNTDPNSTFYPFRQTSGCISQRENIHDGHDWQDQRKLLDRIMIAQGNEANYANETKIKGILYFIEIDNKNAPIEKSDLAALGIE